MRLSVFPGAFCACGLMLLAGCAEPEAPPAPQANSPVATSRTRPSAPELDLHDSLGASEDAAMLRSAPNYSITPSELMSNSTHGVASGMDSMGSDVHTLPGQLPETEALDIDTHLGTPAIELPDESSLAPY